MKSFTGHLVKFGFIALQYVNDLIAKDSAVYDDVMRVLDKNLEENGHTGELNLTDVSKERMAVAMKQCGAWLFDSPKQHAEKIERRAEHEIAVMVSEEKKLVRNRKKARDKAEIMAAIAKKLNVSVPAPKDNTPTAKKRFVVVRKHGV